MSTPANNLDRSYRPHAEEALVEVDLDESDPTKAIERKRVARDLPANEGDDMTAEEQARLDKRSFKKRFTRIENRFSQQLAERDALHQRETAAMRREIDGLKARKEDTSSADDAQHEREIAALTAKIEDALEKGDSKEVAKLNAEIARKEGQHWARKEAKVRGEPAPREERPAPQQQAQVQQPAQKTGAHQLTEQAQAFLDANDDWWTDDDFKIERQYALMMDEELDEDGYDRSKPAYFDEIARRVKEKFPKLDIKGVTEKAAPRRARDEEPSRELNDARRPFVPSVEGRGGESRRQPSRTGRIALTRSDQVAMRAVGLNPDNDKHVLQWAREGEQLEATE